MARDLSEPQLRSLVGRQRPATVEQVAPRVVVVVTTAAQPVAIAGVDPHRPLDAAADAHDTPDVLALVAPGCRVLPGAHPVLADIVVEFFFRSARHSVR